MLLFRVQSKVVILTDESSEAGQAHLEPTASFETTTSIDDLQSMLHQDAELLENLAPSIEVLDSDSIDRNRRLHRIIPSTALCTRLEPIAPLCAVVVLVIESLDEQVTQLTSLLSHYDVARLLACRRDVDVNACLTVINRGNAEGVVSLESTSDCELVATIAQLKMRKALERKGRIADLVGFGPTSFLKDAQVMQFITTRAASLGAVELRLILEPPGVLMIGHDFSPAFLMICDVTYVQALREIALDCRTGSPSPGLQEPASGISLTDLADHVRPISTTRRWFYCEIPFENIPSELK